MSYPHVVLSFQDGGEWSTRDGSQEADERRDCQIMDFGTERSGVPVTYITAEDIE